MKPSTIVLAGVLIICMLIPKVKVNPVLGILIVIGIGTFLFFLFSHLDDKK